MKLRPPRIPAPGACLAGMVLILSPAERLAAQCGEPPDMILPADGQEYNYFGKSVALSGDLLIVGAEGDDDHVCGAAYLFRHNGTDWIEEQQLLPDDEDCDYFGGFGSLAVSGDLAVVPSLLDGGVFWDYGAAYVFRFDGASWTQEQKLLSSDQTAIDIYFGMSADVESDTIILGAHWDSSAGSLAGAADVFQYDGSRWTLTQTLTASDAQPYQWFGFPVALSGDAVLIGAFGDGENGGYAGAAYVFRRSGEMWIEEQKLLPTDGDTYDYFGHGVALDSDVALIVATFGEKNPGGGYGSAYVFRYDGSRWFEEQKLVPPAGENFSNSVAIRGNLALVGTYLFRFDGRIWSEVTELTAGGQDLNHFETPVTIGSDVAAVGAFTDDVNGVSSGSAFLFDIACLNGDKCEGDANGDDVVDPLDSGFVLSRLGCDVGAGDPDCDVADQNDDGLVDPLDVGFVLARFGECE